MPRSRDMHRRNRWTPERIAIIERALAEGMPRAEIVPLLRSLPGDEVSVHHVTGFVRYHYGSDALTKIAPTRRQAPVALNRFEGVVPWYATAAEVLAWAREMGMTGRVTLQQVNEARAAQKRDPFVLIRRAA